MTPIEAVREIRKVELPEAEDYSASVDETYFSITGNTVVRYQVCAFRDETGIVAIGSSEVSFADAIRRCVANYFARKIEVAA